LTGIFNYLSNKTKQNDYIQSVSVIISGSCRIQYRDGFSNSWNILQVT